MPRKKKSPNSEQTTQSQEAEPQEQPGQRYDSTFKDWVNRQPAVILPLLLIGAVYLTHLDVERIQTSYAGRSGLQGALQGDRGDLSY